MMNQSGSAVALVTGATVGIGYEFCRLLARDGHDLVLVARNATKLAERKEEFERDYGISATVISADLSLPASPQAIFDSVRTAGIDVDTLINNAGFGTNGNFVTADLERQLDMIQVNVSSLVALSRLFLPAMAERGKGRIMNVSSTASFQPGPSMAVYYATKAFVTSFTEAVSHEMRDTGVMVQTFCPGPTRTEFADRAGFQNVIVMDRSSMSAEEAAAIGYKQLRSGKRLVIAGLMNRVMANLVRISPRKLTLHVVETIQKSRQKAGILN